MMRNVSRSEVEMNMGWARNNPALFVDRVSEFQLEHPVADWRHCIDLSRKGFITLIAHRRDEPYVMTRDYLTEIGMEWKP